MNNQQAMIELIKATSGQANILTIPRPYIEFMGSLDGGLFLSQLIYWSDRGGRGDEWFYKTYTEWEEETTLSKYEVSKQAKILKAQDILETKIKKANGAPTVHYRFSFDEFQKSLVKFLHYGKSRNFTMENQETSLSITETTTEITTSLPKNSKLEKQNLNTLAEQIATITQIDIGTISDSARNQIKKLTVALSKKNDIKLKLAAFPAWYADNDWRGKQGQPPTVWTLSDTWGQFEVSQAKPQNGSAPALTDEMKKRLAELTAQDAQK